MLGKHPTRPGHGFRSVISTHSLTGALRYLVNDLRTALLEHSTIDATVQRINRPDAPFARRVLVELRGGVPAGFEPMASAEYIVVGE